ncbi:alpha/beta hydrolase [Polluticoccus soli]|uniref:alpha/beta hydrolase n=1 Tax=Polluticoccus soli TaxID=3034150 RepID=UPI0023E2EFFA|nr:alpha/beta fold hydrolase [Flavipsychrobacter sp. JY13-12]
MRCYLLVLAVAISCTACNFNKVYLQPQPLPPAVKKLRMTNPVTGDTTVVYFSGNNLLPELKDGRDQPKKTGFTIQSNFIKSSSGNDIYSWFVKPVNSKPLATILFLHGNAGNILSHISSVLPLVQQQYQVLIIDYSGFGFSGGSATRSNVRKDANTALRWLSALPGVKDGKLVVYGQSLGGHLAAVVAADNEQLVDGLIIEGAFSSHKDIAAARMPVLGRALVNEQYSAMEALSRFHKPVLVIHSTEDKVIPFFMGKKLYEQANQPKQFYEIGHAHIEGPEYYADSISQKLKRMLNI